MVTLRTMAAFASFMKYTIGGHLDLAQLLPQTLWMARGYHNVEYCVTITAWVRCWDGHFPEFQTQPNAVSTRWTYQGFLHSCDTGSKHKHCMCNRVLGDVSLPDGFWPWEPEAEGNILLFPTSFTIPQLAFLWSSSELLCWILLLSIIPRLPVFTNNRASLSPHWTTDQCTEQMLSCHTIRAYLQNFQCPQQYFLSTSQTLSNNGQKNISGISASKVTGAWDWVSA
jgi:hypothetical protein